MLQEIWHDANHSSRAGLVIGFIVIVAFTLAAGYWLMQDKQAVLFTELEPRDGASVVAELERMKVDYELGAGGTQVLVSEDLVHEVRMKMMASGAPMGGSVGFEIFDDSEFGMTEFAQRINFQRALQGELTRTIMALKEVKVARVHLVLPENSLFRQNENPPSASITLFLKRGMNLTQEQTQGIQRLVSASVPGLDASNVTVADQNGVTLSRVIMGENSAGEVSIRLQKKQEVEAYLKNKVEIVLERTFGKGEAIVSINATLNFDQTKTTREEVIPQTDLSGRMIRKSESYSGAAKSKKSKDNDPGAVNTDVEYRLGREVSQIVSTPGSIQRLSVGIVVPSHTTAERLEQIKDLVAMTVGLDIKRGDAIAVHGSEKDAADYSYDELFSMASMPMSEEIFTDMASPVNELDSVELEMQAADLPALRQERNIAAHKSQSALQGYIEKARSIGAQHNVLISVIFAILTLLLFWLIRWTVISRRHRTQIQNRLSAAERERVLGQVQEWLSADDVSAQTETGAS